MADTIVGDMNDDQKNTLEGWKSGFNQGPGILARAWSNFVDWITDRPGAKGPRPKRDEDRDDIANQIKQFVERHREDPQIGDMRNVDSKIEDVSGSMLGGTLSDDFSGINEDQGGVPFGEPVERSLEYSSSPNPMAEKKPIDTDWVIETRSEGPWEENPKVEKAQEYLIELFGEDAVGPDKVDGKLGKNTEAALRRFQQGYNALQATDSSKIREDGNLDHSTLAAITTMAMFSDDAFKEPEEGSILD